MSGFVQVERVPEYEDNFKGKQFIYRDPLRIGEREEVDFTIRQNDSYSVIFKSGIQMSVSELNSSMSPAADRVELSNDIVDPLHQPMSHIFAQANGVEPGTNNGINVVQHQPVVTESPIKALLKKSKMVEQEIPLIIKSLSIDTFSILSESFENFLDELVDYISESPDLKASIKTSLMKYYNVPNED